MGSRLQMTVAVVWVGLACASATAGDQARIHELIRGKPVPNAHPVAKPPRSPVGEGSISAETAENRAPDSRDEVVAPKPSCRFPKAKCGYLDSSGRTIVAPDYDWSDGFAGPVARVKLAGRYGLIGRDGHVVMSASWDYIAPFEGGRALALKDGAWGVIGEHGEVVVPARYAGLLPMSGTIYAASVAGKFQPGASDLAELEREESLAGPIKPMPGRWGILSAPDSWILGPNFREVRKFSPRVSEAIWVRATQKWQLMSFTGLPLTSAIYDSLDDGADDLVVTRTANQFNVVDRAGHPLLPPQASSVRRRPDGVITFQVGELTGAVANGGKLLLSAKFKRILDTRSGYLHAVKDGSDVWYDASGQPAAKVPEPPSTDPSVKEDNYAREAGGAVLVCDDGVKVVHKGEAWGYFDFRNVPFIAPLFPAAGCFERGEAYVVHKERAAWCRIDKTGRFVAGQPCSCRPQSLTKSQFKAGGRLRGCTPPAAGDFGASP